jgi:hypothetical protein
MKNEIDKNYLTLRNTLTLVGYSVEEEEKLSYTDWEGRYLRMSKQDGLLIIHITKRYVSCVYGWEKSSIVTLPNSNTVSKNLDLLLIKVLQNKTK